MSGLLAFQGVKATNCVAAPHHTPVPLRFVFHHVLPLAAGGLTTSANLVSVCDSCHYAIHAMLYEMATNAGELTTLKKFKGTPRWALAAQGYTRALAAGTVGKLPNEGE